jgi:hypothetical protein
MKGLLFLKAILMIMVFLFNGSIAFGQVTSGSIQGVVRDRSGETIPGATVLIRNEETGFNQATTTNQNGFYTIQQLPLGNDYSVTVSFVGFGNVRQSGYQLGQGDVLRVDFILEERSETLDEVSIVANPLTSQKDRMGAATSVTASDLANLPVNGRNFTSLIDLSPVSRGSNLLGQLFSSTNYVIDGMSNRSPVSSGTTNRGPFSISMEAIREFEIITNDYSVINGRSGGGIVSAVTKSGTNTFQGSAFLYNRANWLSSPYDIRGNERDEEFAIQQYGFSLGGPIVKDRSHFFITYDGQYDARPLYIADIRGPEDEARYNISQTSLDRFLQIARDQYGLAASQQTGAFDKNRFTHTFFGRVDWQINPTNLLTVRNNFSYDLNSQGVGDNSSINLYEVYGDHLSMANSLMASLRTILSPRTTNELKFQYLYTLDDGRPSKQLPSQNIPRAIVQRVESNVDGNTVYTTVQIGGQRYLPETFESNVFQLVNNYHHNTGKVNYTFGADIMLNYLSSLATSEMNGRFFFTGLDNFENKVAYNYAREVSFNDPTVDQYILGAGAYAEAIVNPGVGMDLTIGLRADYTGYLNKPEFNQLVFDELGLRTDNSAAGFQIQPRFQFTWDINDRSKDVIKIGGGVFGSALNNYSMINNLQFDGTKIFAVDLRGDQVPNPDFPAYRNNPSTAPGVELFDLEGVSKVPTINMNSSDLKVPTIYKGNISYNKFMFDKVRVGVNFIAAFARNNYMYVDRNMVDEPFFRIDNEANRGVFVPSTSINTTNGSANWRDGRKSDKIGRVLELVSEGKNNTYTFVVDGTYRYFRDGEITMSYTWNDTKDNTSYNGNVANSATLFQMVVDDPRDLSRMNYSNVQFRNKVVGYGTLPSIKGFVVGVRYSGIGGTRYSLRVSGNVNGDFVNSNDLAFVFDPNNASTNVDIADGMRQLLANPENLAADYMRESMGKIAERNGGINGFYGTWDVRVAKKFTFANKSGFELSADLFNVANFLNKEKGSSTNLSDQNLLTIRSFDTATRRYNYAVNSNAGVAFPGGTPYQFQIGARYFF